MKEIKNKSRTPWDGLPQGRHTLQIGSKRSGFRAFIWKGHPGPALLVNGATHGDEYEGPTLLTELVHNWKPRSLKGTIVAVPVLNEPAFYAGTRNHPEDDGNLARVFPGNRHGSASEKLAATFRERCIRFSDYYIDFHSAGVNYEILPWVGFMTLADPGKNEVQKQMAACFPNLWCWESPYLPGRTISAAAEWDIPHLYTESKGGGGVTPTDLQDLRSGFFSVLKLLGFLPEKPEQTVNWKCRVTTDQDEAHLQLHHPSPIRGIFIPGKKLKDAVRKNQVIGQVHALDGTRSETIKAQRSGIIVNIRRKRSVEKGEALATIVP